MNIHHNARLTPRGRAILVSRLERSEHPEDVATAMGVSTRTVYKWWRRDKPLKRRRNIAENRFVSFVVDRYDDHDGSRLGWVMLRGQADILHSGAEHAEAQRLLRRRYAQLNEMAIGCHSVIAIRIEHATSWGSLAEGGS